LFLPNVSVFSIHSKTDDYQKSRDPIILT